VTDANQISGPWPRAASFVEVLRTRAERRPDQLAFVFLDGGQTEGPRLTYADLDAWARAIAVRIRAETGEGDRALLFYQPGMDFVPAFFGCLYAGVVAVPLYPPRPNRDVQRVQSIAADCGAKLVLTTQQMVEHLEEGCRQIPSLTETRWIATDACRDAGPAGWREPAITRESLALLQYTSGSTAAPKGVMVTHGNLLHNSDGIRRAFELTPDSVSVSWLPAFHDMGLIDGVLQPVYTGFPAYLMAPIAFLQQPIHWLRAISRYGVDHSGGPNFAYDLCVAKTTPEQRAELDLSRWRSAYNGAEPVRAATLERFAKSMEPAQFRDTSLFPCYGLAEATLMVTGTPLHEAPRTARVAADALEQHRFEPRTDSGNGTTTLVSSGHAIHDTRVAVVDPQTHQQVAPGQIGEIWISGPGVTRGYWNKPEVNQVTFEARIEPTGDGPFLRTGDLGVLQGSDLFVTGRIKDMIIIRGRNHYPQDIEATMQESNSGLRKGCGAAFGVDVSGEERLVVVQELDRGSGDGPVQEIIGDIRQAIVELHDIDPFDIVLIRHATIPKTTSGKLQRHACRIAYQQATIDRIAALRGSDE
jgi:acyl-CoA synthetase (AMP-forming)/AMP-acid ligase II